jgi:hypothetical protein
MRAKAYPTLDEIRHLAETWTLDRIRHTVMIAFLVLVAAAVANAGTAVETNSATGAWGPVYRGLQLSVIPVSKVFSLGEPIQVAVIVTNTTAKPISLTVIVLGSKDRYDIKLLVADAKGQKVPFTKLGSILEGPPVAVSGNVAGILVAPNSSIRDIVRLDDRFELGTTGKFSVTARRLVPDANNKLAPELVSTAAEFEIAPAK